MERKTNSYSENTCPISFLNCQNIACFPDFSHNCMSLDGLFNLMRLTLCELTPFAKSFLFELSFGVFSFFLMSKNVVSGLELMHICEAAGKSLGMN